jgi:hypothetical protein
MGLTVFQDPQQGGLAHAIAPQRTYLLALFDGQGDTVQQGKAAVSAGMHYRAGGGAKQSAMQVLWLRILR